MCAGRSCQNKESTAPVAGTGGSQGKRSSALLATIFDRRADRALGKDPEMTSSRHPVCRRTIVTAGLGFAAAAALFVAEPTQATLASRVTTFSSSQAMSMGTYAADVAALAASLDLRNAIHVAEGSPPSFAARSANSKEQVQRVLSKARIKGSRIASGSRYKSNQTLGNAIDWKISTIIARTN